MNTNLSIVYPETALSLRAYKALERKTDIRHEYYDGEVVSIAGGSGRHGILCSNINFEIQFGLKNKGIVKLV